MTKVWVRFKCKCNNGLELNNNSNKLKTCKICKGKGYSEEWLSLTEFWQLIRQDQLQEEKELRKCLHPL